jgi:signal transduction histidine kinase
MTALRARLSSVSVPDRVAIAIVTAMALLVVLLGEKPDGGGAERSLDALAIGIFLGAVALLLLSDRFPATVAIAELAINALWYVVGYRSRLIDAPGLVAFYVVGTTGDRRRQLRVGAITIAGLVVANVPFTDQSVRIALAGVGWIVTAMLFGELVHNRRLLLEQAAERAARERAETQAEADRRIADERLRIARDVHDVLAHTVSVMTVQAGVAADVLERDPASARSALSKVRAAGREALTEVRATVAVLRGARPAERVPFPGLDRVTELVDGARAQGLDVAVSVNPNGGEDVQPLVELTVYRVVQEAITNVIRHAGASRAGVQISRNQTEIIVEVHDDGVSSSQARVPVPGYGLRGMAERVAAVGGTLSYGPDRGGGWTVEARLPVTAPGH